MAWKLVRALLLCKGESAKGAPGVCVGGDEHPWHVEVEVAKALLVCWGGSGMNTSVCGGGSTQKSPTYNTAWKSEVYKWVPS